MTVQESGPQITTADDPRITRAGSFLRKSKLDEVPQFVNVLLGDMSLVGPRPEVPMFVELWPEPSRSLILAVRPGITDPLTLQLRNESRMLQNYPDPVHGYVTELLPQKIAAYCNYVENLSIKGDFKILARTVAAIFNRN